MVKWFRDIFWKMLPMPCCPSNRGVCGVHRTDECLKRGDDPQGSTPLTWGLQTSKLYVSSSFEFHYNFSVNNRWLQFSSLVKMNKKMKKKNFSKARICAEGVKHVPAKEEQRNKCGCFRKRLNSADFSWHVYKSSCEKVFVQRWRCEFCGEEHFDGFKGAYNHVAEHFCKKHKALDGCTQN